MRSLDSTSQGPSSGQRWWTAALALSGALVLVAILAAAAQGARIHELLLSETLPEERTPLNVTVNETTHHFYVVGIFEGQRNVYNFEANGQIDPVSPELTGAPTVRPQYVALDNSGGAHAGYVYGSDPFNSLVQQYDASGVAAATQITGSTVPPNGTAQSGGLPPVVNTGSFTPRAVAVDGIGQVLVVEAAAEAIDVFTAEGAFVKQLAAGKVNSGNRGLALDAAGNMFVANEYGPLGAGLFEFEASGECATLGCAPIDAGIKLGVAVDQAGEVVYTTSSIGSEEGQFSEYEAPTGMLLGRTRPAALHSPFGIGVQEASGEVVVADSQGTVQLYGPVEIVPDVELLAPEGIEDHGAILKGRIGAAGVPGATCTFQYVTEEEFEESRFEDAAEAACQPEGPFSGTTMEDVHAELSGLRGGTTYYYRLVGRNENGSNQTETAELLTLGPTVSGSEAVAITQTGATLKGFVNPNSIATTYAFQYLTQAQFEVSGWAGASEVPAGGASAGSGSTAVEVTAAISGLQPGTAYRMRILASSGPGKESEGEVVEFATFANAPSSEPCPNEAFRAGRPAAALPDCRAYEQASPVDKNGANVQGEVSAVQAALQGSGVTFITNTGIPGGEGSQQFPIYMASRGAGGWSTQGLLPPASYGSLASVLGWDEGFETTYDFASGPAEGRLLRRENASSAVSTAGTLGAGNNPLAYAGSSAGGAVALLESREGGLMTGDLEGGQNVYVYDRASGRLVLAGTMNDETPPAEGAMAGPYDWFASKSTAAFGGALGFYFTQAEHAISGDGSKAFFTAAGSGQLYVRLNPLAAQSAMSGEECSEPAKACTVRISAPEEGVADPGTPAAFVGASADGNLAYFLDRGKLTVDATGGSGYDLYRYDLKSGDLTDLSLDATDKSGARVEGLLGIGGKEGEDVYFAAAGALTGEATQAPAGETNLYGLVNGELHLLARIGTSEGAKGEERNWAPRSRLAGSKAPNTARVSNDGQTLLFRSARKLTAYRNHGVAELYLFRIGDGISCVSCNPSGEAPAGAAGVQEIPELSVSQERLYGIETRNLSADGRRVIFDSADRLVAADQNSVNDVYEWEAKGKGSCESEVVAGGCIYLISSGEPGAQPAYFADADAEGENVFFFTDRQLVAQDKDELVDVYDARVEGGLAAQGATPPPVCQGEGECRGAAEGGPATAAPLSPGANGANVVPAKPCKKGKVRRHGKCVPRHKHKKKRHHRKRHGHHHKAKQGKKHNRGGDR